MLSKVTIVCLQIFDYVVDNESYKLVKWQDQVPQYSGTPHAGIPQDAFVNTVNTQVQKTRF